MLKKIKEPVNCEICKGRIIYGNVLQIQAGAITKVYICDGCFRKSEEKLVDARK